MKQSQENKRKLAGFTAALAIAVLTMPLLPAPSAAHAMQSPTAIAAANFGKTELKRHAQDAIQKQNTAVKQSAVEKKYIKRLTAQFRKELEKTFGSDLDWQISSQTITNSPDWFTIKFQALQQQASSTQVIRYFTINKANNKEVRLYDLFKKGSDYKKLISSAVKSSMRKQMKKDKNIIYFIDSEDMPETNFRQIKTDQNFYFNKKGQLVIVFNEYEIAPGYMGCPEFVVTSKKVLSAMK